MASSGIETKEIDIQFEDIGEDSEKNEENEDGETELSDQTKKINLTEQISETDSTSNPNEKEAKEDDKADIAVDASNSSGSANGRKRNNSNSLNLTDENEGNSSENEQSTSKLTSAKCINRNKIRKRLTNDSGICPEGEETKEEDQQQEEQEQDPLHAFMKDLAKRGDSGCPPDQEEHAELDSEEELNRRRRKWWKVREEREKERENKKKEKEPGEVSPSSTSSPDEDANDSDDDDTQISPRAETSSSSSEDEEDPQVKFRPPPHKWSMNKSLRKREYGLRSKGSTRDFITGVTGSLHMVQRFELMYKLDKHDGCVNCLNFNASGTRLASGSDDTNVTVWDWATGDPILTFDTKHRANVFQCKFMPLSGDCHIVTCARDGQVRLAELSVRGVCKETRRLAAHRGAAHKLSVEQDSPHVFLSCGEDAVVYQVDLRDPKPNKILVCKEGNERVALYSIHSSPRDSVEFAVSGRDEFCRIYDKRQITQINSTALKKFCPHHLVRHRSKPNVTCVVYNYNGSELLGSYNDEEIYSFDTSHSDGADSIRKFSGHRNNATVKGVNWYGPKSEFVVSGSDCGHVYLWEKESEKIVQFLHGDEGGVVNCLEPHPSLPVLATSGLDHDVKIWVPSNEKPGLNLENLQKAIRENRRGRRREPPVEQIMDAQFFRYILQRLRARRSGRRRRREGEEEGDDADETSDAPSGEDSDSGPNFDDDEEDEEGEGEGEGGRTIVLPSCRTS